MCSAAPPPPPPDYAAAAVVQGQDNKDAATYNTAVNRVDQYTPTGSSTWSLRPGADPNNPQAGDYIQTTALSPDQQQLQTAQNSISENLAGVAQAGLNRVGAAVAQPFDTSTLPQLQGASPDSYAAQTKAIQDATYAQLAPQLAQNREQEENKLLNSGIERGSQAWSDAERDLSTADNNANLSAVLAGSQEQSRLAGLEQSANQFNNQTRSQAMSEESYLRQVPLNELNALRTGSQVSSPTFSGYYTGGNVAPVNSYGATQDAYNAQVGNTNAANASSAGTTSAVAGLAGAALMAF